MAYSASVAQGRRTAEWGQAGNGTEGVDEGVSDERGRWHFGGERTCEGGGWEGGEGRRTDGGGAVVAPFSAVEEGKEG